MLQNVTASARIEVQLQNAAFASVAAELGRRITAQEGWRTEKRFDLPAGHADGELWRGRQRRDAALFPDGRLPIRGGRGDAFGRRGEVPETAGGQAQSQRDRPERLWSRVQSPPPAV